MPPAPVLSTAVRALSTGGETAFRAQTAHPLEKSLRPMNGLRALGGLPAGIMGATTAPLRYLGLYPGAFRRPCAGALRRPCGEVRQIGRSAAHL